MSAARIFVLVIAGVAALGAALVMRSLMSGPAPQQTIVAEAPRAPSAHVLTAGRDLAIGERVEPQDLAWTEWPESAAGSAFIRREGQPDAIESYTGAMVRVAMTEGEPVLPGKLVEAGAAGYMAAMLAPGMRALSIPISVESGAGGFILPGDRVDVLLTRPSDGAGHLAYITETILENVLVLAIDQTPQDDAAERTALGSTATLELSPEETRMVTQAGAVGSLSLTLRSAADSQPDSPRGAVAQSQVQSSVQVYRYGGARQVAVQNPSARNAAETVQ